MSSRLPTACLAVVVLLSLTRYPSSAAAKPPDLPMNPQITCAPAANSVAGTPASPLAPREEATGTPTGGAIFPWARIESADSDEVDVRTGAAWCSALRNAQRCLLFGLHPLLSQLPAEDLTGDEYEDAVTAVLGWVQRSEAAETTSPTPAPTAAERMPQVIPPPPDGFVCPYLREQDARRHATQPCPLAEPADVLGNLHKLEEAQKALRLAEFFRDTGHLASAAFYYEAVRRLCPGSRYDEIAGARLQELRGRRTPTDPWPQRRMVTVVYSVGDLLAGDGIPWVYLAEDQLPEGDNSRFRDSDDHRVRDEHAEERLIQCIVSAVHPQSWSVMGGPGRICFFYQSYPLGQALLITQTPDVQEQVAHLLASWRRLKHQAAKLPRARGLSSEGASSSAAATPPCRMRSPDLPPVDPHVAGALDRVLTTVGESAENKLSVTVEEAGGTAEEEEPAGADRPGAATEPDMPTFFLEPSEDKPGANPARSGTVAPADAAKWWCDLLDVLRSAACVEVDGPPLCSRGRCQVSVGSATTTLSWDCRDEHGSFLLWLGLGEAPESRAAPCEPVDQVTRWIEQLFGSAGQP